METVSIIARSAEQSRLETIYRSGKSELLAMYGRRRVGKTFIIRQLFKPKGVYFEFTGIHKAGVKVQLSNFAMTLSEAFYHGSYMPDCPDWLSAVMELRKAIANVPGNKRVIIFFDELPWFATPRSGALEAIEHLWNRYLSDDNRVMMVLCGSAAAWMIRKVVRNKGGLHGRLTAQMRLQPFSLGDAEAYLRAQNIRLDRKQLIELYFAFGGIPKYLSYVRRGQSVAQSINEICFSDAGAMHGEFDGIFRALFNHAERHIQIVKTLAKHPYGLKQKDLLQKVKIPSGGTASGILLELVESGFVLQMPHFNKGVNDCIILLSDEYSLFYLTWMQGQERFHSGLSAKENYWQSVMMSQAWQSWCGVAFERVCLKHIQKIKEALGISGVITQQSVCRIVKNQEHSGAQIDLIIDRADGCINLCEIRFYNKQYCMTQKEAEKINQRREIFREVTQSKKAIFNTLITTYGAAENNAYLQAIDNQLMIDALFD